MSDLTLNDDGSVTLPLHNHEPVTLPEPNAAQLVAVMQLVNVVDQSLTPTPTNITTESTTEELNEASEQMRKRTMETFSDAAPYGMALIKMVELLTSTSITLDQLPGWALSPATCRKILTHFQTPLPGAD